MRNVLFSSIIAGSLLAFGSHAFAHSFWIEARRGHFEGVFGHESSVEGYPSKSLTESWAWDEQGNAIQVDVQRLDDHARLVPREPPAVLVAALDGQFFSRTEGEGVNLKYGITVLKPKAKLNLETAKDIRMVLLPEVDPLSVGAGNALPIRVLVDGKPVAGVKLSQDYRGLGTRSGSGDSPPTDKDGRTRIVVRNPGWNVIAGFHRWGEGKERVTLQSTLAFQGNTYVHN